MNNPTSRNSHLSSRNRVGASPNVRDNLSPSPNILIRILFVCFFVFDFPAFVGQLAYDPSGKFTGSPVLAFTTLAGELFAVIVILSTRNGGELMRRCRPVLAMIGLGFISALWSLNPKATIGVTFRNAGVYLLGIALVAQMPQFQSVRFAIRTMAFGCALSIVWVFIFPESAVHQQSDAVQSVHAGLWRGIFTHKQGLGLFAGMTTGLLLFYRTLIFSPLILIGALGCSITCLIGTQSATGAVAVALVLFVFYSGRFVILSDPRLRRTRLLLIVAAFVVVGGAFQTGLLNPIITQVIGKSSDLTGRADAWPIEIANFNSSGRSLLGGGLGADFASDLYDQSVDNGYLDMLFVFGYLISPILYLIFLGILWKGGALLLSSPRETVATNVFPFGIWAVILITNITESNFMTKTYGSVLTAMAVALVFEKHNQHVRRPSEQASRSVSAPSKRPLA